MRLMIPEREVVLTQPQRPGERTLKTRAAR